ncbi:MAG: type III-A CRISPR-associated protein Cas10/Csm1 [Candidatus Ancillula sp.]|nr:type III-A CRISPR-associated protein Cas10/Csm1 [Candidatus Ancillula sp.]
MDDKLVNTIYGCLLHDLGKVTQRAEKSRTMHGKHGAQKLEEWNIRGKCPVDVIHSVRYHMAKEMAGSHEVLDMNAPAYIAYIADNIAAGTDRRADMDDEEGKYGEVGYRNSEDRKVWDSELALASIFSAFGIEKTDTYYNPQMLDDYGSINFPEEKSNDFNWGIYTEIAQKLEKFIKEHEFTQYHIASMLNLLEATCSFVPSSTNTTEINDISLYDHLKLTAAFGSAIYYYLQDKKEKDFKRVLKDNSTDFYQEKAFLMVNLNISGIQDFIYTIVDGGAAKTLRARSFYLEMMTEYFIDKLLNNVDLSRASLLYSGAGSAYLIFANTDETKRKVDEFEMQINNFLLDTFGISLYLATAYCEFSAKDIMIETTKLEKEVRIQNGDMKTEKSYIVTTENAKKYAESLKYIYQQVSLKASKKKLHRYNTEQIIKLNSNKKASGTECKICGSIVKESKDPYDIKCSICQSLLDLSNLIQSKRDNYFIVRTAKGDVTDGIMQRGLPIGPSMYLYAEDEDKIKEEQANLTVDNSRIFIYRKNKFFVGENLSNRILVGDYTVRKTYEELANASVGISRLAAMRLDVDNLGQAFISGFSKLPADKPGIYNSISRSASFSRSMSLFFKFYINYLLNNPEYRGITYAMYSKPRDCQIIYAGGDDLFIVGAWNEVIEFAVDFNKKFKQWTNGKLTVSAGIGIFDHKYPVSQIAIQTGELENAAKMNNSKNGDKNYTEKNSIALFSQDFVFTWQDFEELVINDKYNEVRGFFEHSNLSAEYGKAFIYNLLGLIRESSEPITTARWVYFLSRMEPDDKNKHEDFSNFAQKMFKWFKDDDNRKQLECALQLYVYTIRENPGDEETEEK